MERGLSPSPRGEEVSLVDSEGLWWMRAVTGEVSGVSGDFAMASVEQAELPSTDDEAEWPLLQLPPAPTPKSPKHQESFSGSAAGADKPELEGKNMLVHEKCGHLGEAALQGQGLLTSAPLPFCEPCVEGKATRKPIGHGTPVSRSDLGGGGGGGGGFLGGLGRFPNFCGVFWFWVVYL